MYILAYDFGTGGIKASLYGADGACVASGFDAYETSYPASGFHEQAPEDWWRATVRSTRLLAAQAGDEAMKRVCALGISGHSLGVVPLDAMGNLLRPTVPIWSDSRAGAEAQVFFREVPEEAWYMKTGNGFPPALYSVFKLIWFRVHEPDWFGRAATILGTKDYINFRLCGVRATDFSYASGTGVYDLASRRYDESLIAASGLPRGLFPEIVPATQMLGTLTADAARELGLPQDVKVVAGGVDNSCMALGAGAWREGRAYCSLGSSAWIAESSAKPLLDVATRPYVFDHVVPGQYASALAIFSAGTAHTWCRDVLCGGMDYTAMDAEADAEGRQVAHIERKFWTLHERHFVTMADGSQFEISNELWHIVKDITNIEGLGWQLRGNIVGLNFELYDADGSIMAVIGQKMFSIHDKYCIDIYQKEHEETVVAILVALQHMMRDRAAAASGGSSGGSSSGG